MEDKKSHNFLNNRGQSTVEYILLLVVVTSLITVVMKSPQIRQWVGGGGELYKTIARSIEFSYRYGHNGIDDNFQNNYNNIGLKSYSMDDGSGSRFFSPETKYAQ